MAARYYLQGINQQNCVRLFRYSDSISNFAVAKNMRDVLDKWMLREKYVKYQNFPTPFGLSLSLECSGKISRQSVKSAYHIRPL